MKALALWAWHSWATRSLAMGSLATVVDLSFGAVLLALSAPTRVASLLTVEREAPRLVISDLPPA